MTIYIRPDGTISGSNKPFPYMRDYVFMADYDKALTAWKESCIDFEDQESGKWLACYSLGQSDRKLVDILDLSFDGSGRLKTDLIIENVDVETEKQWQYQHESGDWVDCEHPSNYEIQNPELEYRTVLRIKDKQ